MNKDFFQIKLTPDPYEAFNLSQGIIFEQLLFISGQTSVDETGELLFPKDFKAQANQAFQNLEKVLLAGDSSLSRVLKVTIFLRDMRDFTTIVDLRKKYFSEPFPADSIVEISGLFHPEALIEIEAIALRNT